MFIIDHLLRVLQLGVIPEGMVVQRSRQALALVYVPRSYSVVVQSRIDFLEQRDPGKWLRQERAL
jgi:hypothetical protein